MTKTERIAQLSTSHRPELIAFALANYADDELDDDEFLIAILDDLKCELDEMIDTIKSPQK